MKDEEKKQENIKNAPLAFPQPIAATPSGEMYCAVEKHSDFGGMTLRQYAAIHLRQTAAYRGWT